MIYNNSADNLEKKNLRRILSMCAQAQGQVLHIVKKKKKINLIIKKNKY